MAAAEQKQNVKIEAVQHDEPIEKEQSSVSLANPVSNSLITNQSKVEEGTPISNKKDKQLAKLDNFVVVFNEVEESKGPPRPPKLNNEVLEEQKQNYHPVKFEEQKI